MNKNLGASAGVLALIPFAVHLVTGPSSDKRPGGESPQPAREEKDKSPAPAGQAGSERESAIEGPWLATQTFFHRESEGVPCLSVASACSAIAWCNDQSDALSKPL